MEHRKRRPGILALLLVALAAALLISVMIGRYSISPAALWRLIAAGLTGQSGGSSAETVLWNVRLPRVLAAAMIGGALAVSGAAYQGIFKNPMVSPDILGASAGASFGAALAIMLGVSSILVQCFSFAFGMAAVLLSFALSTYIGRSKGGMVLILVLTGMVTSALFSAFVSIVKYVADPYDTLPAITFWLMGGLTYITAGDILMLLVPLVLGCLPLFMLRWRLNVLSFGDEEAGTLGLNVPLLRGIIIFCATLLTSSSVAVGGMIGWVGLIVPHLARMAAGPNYKIMLPVSFVMGSLFLVIVDDVSRCAFPQELPLGILTAVIGAPFFMFMLSRGRRGFL